LKTHALGGQVVFVLSHLCPGPEADDEKLLGVFSTREEADQAIAEAVLLPGFSESPDGFHIDEYVVDERCWTEGFGARSPVARLSAKRHPE
jgi:hypothetical protein